MDFENFLEISYSVNLSTLVLSLYSEDTQNLQVYYKLEEEKRQENYSSDTKYQSIYL